MNNPGEIYNIGNAITDQITAMFSRYPALYVYEGRIGGFWLFAELTQIDLLAAEQNGELTLDTLLCGQMVTIDLAAGIQRNQTTHAVRKIHKVHNNTAAIKGIAGMARNTAP